MTISPHALLTPEQRSRLAAMPELGGGNLLATAMAVHPDPHIPFIRTGRAGDQHRGGGADGVLARPDRRARPELVGLVPRAGRRSA